MENINPNHPINELWPPYGVINHIAFLATSHSSKHPAMHSALISEKSAIWGSQIAAPMFMDLFFN